jgi:molecular chaperone GrpE
MAKKKEKNAPEDTEVKEMEPEAAAGKWQKLAEDEEVAENEQHEHIKAGMKGRSQESLENELIDLRTKFASSEDKAVRIQAEMQNLRRRLERDMDNAYKYANEKLIGELLPILDSLTRGLQAVSDEDPAREGMELTLSMLKEVMAKHGVKEINFSLAYL